jgi:hypothetical protein
VVGALVLLDLVDLHGEFPVPVYTVLKAWVDFQSKYLDKKALEIERFSGDSVCLDYLLELTHSC